VAAATPGISLVVPICDELENLEPLVEATLAALTATGEAYELILVDDGSRDGSDEELLRLAKLDPGIIVLRHRRRFGKGAALATGIARARGARIVTIDADLQEDPAELPKLLAALDGGLDLVGGRRVARKDSTLKLISSRMFNRLARWVGGPPLADINCGFKAMSSDLARELPLEAGRFRLMPLVAHWWGYRVGEVDVSHRPRTAGRSHFGGERFPGALFDLFAMVFLFRYEERPGHPFLQAGAVSSLVGLGICMHLAGIWITSDPMSIGHRYPRLAFGVLLLLLGGQLLATGVLGEWLAWRTRATRSHRVEYERRGGSGAEEKFVGEDAPESPR
jgi:glycosyltransferase involved in cell wall biosynthesis